MKWTNKYKLPDRIIRLLPQVYRPNPKRMSVTDLIDAPRIRTLRIEKWDDIVADYSDYLNTIIGLSVHDRVESKSDDDELAEHKLVKSVDSKGNPFGIDLVGRSDTYIESLATIIDTKTKAVGFERLGKKDLIEQLNIYAYLQRLDGKTVKKLLGDIILRDWKLREVIKHDYPKIAYIELKVPLWSFEEQEDHVKKQIEYHLTCPMDCDNRWRKKDTWAVKKKGKQRAERVLDSKDEAEKWMKENRGDFIEFRKGECTRCEYYCSVRTVCKDSSHYLGDKNGLSKQD